MANLIITVISIALVAVAALMGAYYGGTAFMDGRTTAYANTIVQQANQLKAGYTLYLADGNTPLPSDTYLNGTGADTLTGNKKYLSNIIIPSPNIAGGHPNNWLFFNPYLGSGPQFVLRVKTMDICRKLLQIYVNSNEILVDGYTIGNSFLIARINKYGAYCWDWDGNHDGILNDQLMFVVKA